MQQHTVRPTCAPYHGSCPYSDVTVRPPHCCSNVPCRQQFQFFLLLLLFLALNVSLEICLLFFLHFFFSLSFLPGLSIFVASVRYKWWPSGDLPYTRCFFFWQTSLKYTFQPPSIQATYGTRTLNCEPSIYFSTKEHPSYSFLFSCLLLYVQ